MINEELKILNDISIILYNSTNNDYDTANIEHKFNEEESWESISYWYTKEGKNFSSENYNYDKDKILEKVKSLHSIMKKRTGGDWRKFILNIDENKEVKTNFIYESQSCLDDLD